MNVIARRLAVLVLAVPVLAAPPGPAGAAETRYTVPAGDSPSVGAPGAPVVLVEFIDYQ